MRRLFEAQKKQTNELLKMQITGYIEYIRELIDIGEIMTKKFFIIVPYNPLGDKNKSFWVRLKESFSPGAIIKLKKEKFMKYKEELDLRISNIQSNLSSMGLDAAVLDTQSLIELYYNVYNPKTSQNQHLKNISELRIEES